MVMRWLLSQTISSLCVWKSLATNHLTNHPANHSNLEMGKGEDGGMISTCGCLELPGIRYMIQSCVLLVLTNSFFISLFFSNGKWQLLRFHYEFPILWRFYFYNDISVLRHCSWCSCRGWSARVFSRGLGLHIWVHMNISQIFDLQFIFFSIQKYEKTNRILFSCVDKYWISNTQWHWEKCVCRSCNWNRICPKMRIFYYMRSSDSCSWHLYHLWHSKYLFLKGC